MSLVFELFGPNGRLAIGRLDDGLTLGELERRMRSGEAYVVSSIDDAPSDPKTAELPPSATTPAAPLAGASVPPADASGPTPAAPEPKQ